jgi:hypothetical protein
MRGNQYDPSYLGEADRWIRAIGISFSKIETESKKRERLMKKTVTAIALIAGTLLSTNVMAATGLDTYVDKNGFIDVQTLTCAQLADTYQEDANALANWYSGWYNGLAKKHYYHLNRVKGTEHEVIVFCKDHRDMKIIKAMDIIFKEDKKQ